MSVVSVLQMFENELLALYCCYREMTVC